MQLVILRQLEEDFKNPGVPIHRKRDIVMLGSYISIGFCDALRGNKVFLVEVMSLCKYYYEGECQSQRHIVVLIMGPFKGETGEHNHVMQILVLWETVSGIATIYLSLSEKRSHVSCY